MDKLGPIEIEFVLDKKADADAKNLKNSLNAIGTAGQKAADLYSGAVKKQIGLISDLEKSLQKLKEAQKNAHSIEDIEKYNKKIQEAEQDLKGYNEAGIKTAETSDSISASVGKMALQFGGAATILNVLKKAFQETIGGMNLFNNVGAATKQVLYDIVSGGGVNIEKAFSAIAIQQQLNDLRLKGYVESIKATKAEAEFQQLYSDSLDANLSNADKITKINEALAAHDKAIDLQKAQAWKQLNLVVEARKNQPMNEKKIKEETDLINELNRLDAERVESTKRLVRQRSVLIKEGIDDELKWRKDLHDKLQKAADENITYNEDEAKKLRDLNNEIAVNKVNGLDKELLKIKQQYKIDLETYKDNEAIKNALAIKYLQDRYEAEKKYLDKLKEDNLKFAEEIQKVSPAYGTSIIDRAITNIQAKPTGINALRPGIKRATKSSSNSGEVNGDLKEESKLRKEIVDAAAGLVNQIGQQIGLDEKSMALLNAGLDAFTQLAAGNIPGAAAAMLAGIIEQIPTAASRFEAQIEHINQLLKEQQRLIDQSERKGGQEAARKSELDTLNQKAAAEKAEYERLQSIAKAHWDILGWRQKKADEAYQTWQDTTNQIEDANQALADFYTGALAPNSIADTIAQGFKDGKKSAADFAATFNDLMSTAIDSALEEMSKPDIANWQAAFAADMASGGELTDAERANLNAWWDRIIADGKKRRDAAYGVSGVPPTNETAAASLPGAIKGVSEETASVVAGQMNAIRIGQASMNNAMQSSLKQLSEINSNTSHLISIDKKLDALKSDPLRSQGIV